MSVPRANRGAVRDIQEDLDSLLHASDEDEDVIVRPSRPLKYVPPHKRSPQKQQSDGFWRCSQCTMSNENLLRECSVCSAPRPPPTDGKSEPVYICAVCTYQNSDPDAVQCEMCGTKREQQPSRDKSNKDPESKEDQEDGGGKFVMGEQPPPLKRKMLVREHLAFLAGVEESFGTIHLHSALIRGIENIVKPQFELLLKQFAPPMSPLHAVVPSSPPGGAPNNPKDIITSDVLNTILKALVYKASQRAIHAFKTLDIIMACSAVEEEELRMLQCNICHQSGENLILQYSEACCATPTRDNNETASAKRRPRHTFCLSCSHDYVWKFVSESRCSKIECPFLDENGMKCGEELDTKFIRRCLSNVEFKQYLDECFNALIAPPSADAGGNKGGQGTFMHCPNAKCNSIMEICPPHGLVVPIFIKEVDESGKQLSPEAWLHFSSHRVRCHACHMNFCSACKATPYHLGKTCEEWKEYNAAKHCRFCQEQLIAANSDPSNKIPAFSQICTGESCVQKKNSACQDMLPCGHPCPGIVGEPYHPPCLEEDCVQKTNGAVKCTKEDLCNICWVEELGSAPIVQLTSCSHIFHAHCVNEKMQKRWPGVRITFSFLDCSLCKVPMNHPSPEFQTIRKPIDALYKSISEKALARLSIEKMLQDQKLIDPQSRYYNQPLKYAMDCFAYYNCYKCHDFYFGGRRDCEANAAAENRPPEEFVCFNCADLKSISCKNAEHSEYQVWKCRFCCNIASWFCFGTTHYCEPCHKDNPMEKVKRPRSGFKQCPGYQFCPCKREHAPNGAEAECEFNLGCGACQEEITKLQAAREKEKLIEAKVKEGGISHSSVSL